MAEKFSNLKIWQKGYRLLIQIYEITKKFPPEEKFALTAQIRSSANSVIAIIAESHGRYYFADKIRTLYNSRGEIEETQSHLRVSFGLGYITEDEFKEIDRNYENLNQSVNRYINFLRKQKRLTD